MRVTVRLFGTYREMQGQEAIELELPEGATVAEAWEVLCRRLPQSPRLDPGAAVNLEYVGFDTVLKEGDEVAFLPPVSGGE